MPKAGRYDYPYRELDDCIEYLRKANEVSKEHVFTRDNFAAALGQKPAGGGFNMLVGSMAMYKLVDTGEGQVRYTELAKKILHGLSEEQSEARSHAARNVILFADLYDKFGASPSDEQIHHFLRDKANVDIADASSIAKDVSKLFKKLAGYLKPVTDAKIETDNGGDNDRMMNTLDGSQKSDTWILISPYGKTEIKDRISFVAATTLLSALEEKYPKDKNLKPENQGEN